MNDPTNGELALMIADMRRENSESHGRTERGIQDVCTRLDKTNGRVSKLEKWQYTLIGALIFANMVFVPLVVRYLSRLIP